MKKQIRSRNKNSAPKTKPEILTKASSRKHRQKKYHRKELKNIRLSSLPSQGPIRLQTEESMKNESEEI